MIVKVAMLIEEQSILIDLGEDKFEIKDTVNDWLVVNSSEVIVGVFNKFSTVYIILIEEKIEEK